MKKYVKKPLPVEAVQWTGGNRAEIANFCHKARFEYEDDGGWKDKQEFPTLYIITLEGKMKANNGDWILHGNHNDYWPVKKEIFEATYEEYKE